MAFQTKRKYCFFKENNITEIDYKDVKLLKRFINDNGKLCLVELLERVQRCIVKL